MKLITRLEISQQDLSYTLNFLRKLSKDFDISPRFWRTFQGIMDGQQQFPEVRLTKCI